MDAIKTKQLNWRNKRTVDTVDKDAKIILSDDTYVNFSEVISGGGEITPEEREALDSGITAEKVANYDEHVSDTDIHVAAEQKANWDNKYDKPNTGIPMNDLSQEVKDAMVSIYDEDDETLYIDGDRPND